MSERWWCKQQEGLAEKLVWFSWEGYPLGICDAGTAGCATVHGAGEGSIVRCAGNLTAEPCQCSMGICDAEPAGRYLKFV